jgi:hypothetical protein
MLAGTVFSTVLFRKTTLDKNHSPSAPMILLLIASIHSDTLFSPKSMTSDSNRFKEALEPYSMIPA